MAWRSELVALVAMVCCVPTLVSLAPAGPAVAVTELASVECTAPDVGSAGNAFDPDGFQSYVPQLAERIVDTRNDIGGIDEALDAGCTLRIDTDFVVPEGTQGIALSVTVVSPDAGFFTAFPCGAGLPATSSVNARPRLPTANLVAVAPDEEGDVCIYSSNGGHVIVDVSGWWLAGTTPFSPIEPERAYDTRQLAEPVKLPADAIRDVDVAGSIVPDDAVAVAVSIAAVNPTTNGYLVVYPCGVEPPVASNLNFVAGEKRAVSALVEVGVFGKICVTGNAETHFILDVTGFYAPSSPFGPQVELSPTEGERVVDTRLDEFAGDRFTSGDEQRFALTDALERPSESVAVVLNVVAAQPEAPGFLTVHPCIEPRPTTSSLNYADGQTANLVITSLSPDGEVCVFASTGVHVVIDLVGAFVGPPDSLATQMSLSSDGEYLQIDQAYEADGANYTVRCGDDEIDATLRLGGAPGVTITVNGDAVDTLDTELEVLPESLITIGYERGTEVAEHSLRCVPDDFPFLEVSGPLTNADGWYLTGLGWVNAENGKFIAILDDRGVPVWFKRTDRKLIDAKLLSNGALVASPITGRGFGLDSDSGHRIFELDGEHLEVVRPADPTTYPADHHDFVEIVGTDGQRGYAIVSYPIETAQDLSMLPTIDPATGNIADARCGYGDDPIGRTVAGSVIQEVPADPLEPAWTWDLADHFSLAEVTFAQCFGNLPDNAGGEVDIFHLNSLQRIVEPGCEPLCDYVASARHLDAVFRVDRATGTLDWILSSQPSDPLDPAYVPNLAGAPRLRVVDDVLGGPRRMHDARLEGDVLTMHDNRSGTGQPSRVVSYEIDLSDPLDPTATLIREIVHPNATTSGQLGSARVAADGSVVVNWGATQPMFVEYAADGSEQLRIEMPSNDQAYRIIKYPVDSFDVDELRATAGGELELPPS